MARKTEAGTQEVERSSARRGAQVSKSSEPDLASLISPLANELEQLGLSSYEARVLLALLQLGSANTLQLSQVSGVMRTSVYPVLEGLAAKGLAQRMPGEGPAVWGSPGRQEVFSRLDARLEEEFEQQRKRSAGLREAVTKLLPEAGSTLLPYVHLIPGPGQAKRAFDHLLGQAEREVLMFTRPPYAASPGSPNPVVVAMLERGVCTRVLYQSAPEGDSQAEAVWREVDTYHRLGVKGRIVDRLPMKLLVVDQKVALLAMTGRDQGSGGYPTNVLVENEGCAAVQAAAFEHYWAQGQPYSRPGKTVRR